MSKILTGEVIRMGAMNVSGEELDGVFVRVTRDELRALERAPLYQRVALVVIGDGDIDRVMANLCDVYGTLWTEAHYDPLCEKTREFAAPLVPKMQEANAVFKFKE